MKSYIWWSGDPWSAILALAALIIVVSAAGLALVLFTYSKYKKLIISEDAYIDPLDDRRYCGHPVPLNEYETQSLNIYIPSDESVADFRQRDASVSRLTTSQLNARNNHDRGLATVFSSSSVY